MRQASATKEPTIVYELGKLPLRNFGINNEMAFSKQTSDLNQESTVNSGIINTSTLTQ